MTQSSFGQGLNLSVHVFSEIDNRGISHILKGRKAPQDTYHGLSFPSGGLDCIGLTVHGSFTHSSSVLNGICQQALALNSCRRRLIMPRVEWLVFFAGSLLLLLGGGDHLHESPGYQNRYRNAGCSH